tara:strand:+ start:162 stop:950 length:789 start_codon:yes stop_codon:yes gene_type:complete
MAEPTVKPGLVWFAHVTFWNPTIMDTLWDKVRKDRATGLFSVIDVVKSITGKSSGHAGEACTTTRLPGLKSKIQKVRINGKGRLTPVASKQACVDIATRILCGARMSESAKDTQCDRLTQGTLHPESETMQQVFQRHVLQEKTFVFRLAVQAPPVRRVYIECETIETIQRVFHRHPSVKQRPFGPYRVDLYFPEACLVVECDEEQHRWAQAQDATREAFIKGFGARFYRYRPCDPGFDLAEVIAGVSKALQKGRENSAPNVQ